jgi:Cytidylate kinase-like family
MARENARRRTCCVSGIPFAFAVPRRSSPTRLSNRLAFEEVVALRIAREVSMTVHTSSQRLAEALAKTHQHWESRRLAEFESGGERPCQPALTIAISREAGANAGLIARAIGERLGWPIYDRELVQLVADGMKVRASLLDDLDERRSNWIRECIEGFGSGPAVAHGAYVHRLIETLLALASHGQCVIVGRGTAAVLPSATTLRVRLVAPREHRIGVIQERRKVPREEATRWIDTTDRERSDFLRDHFCADPTDPRHCDLVLNTARFTVAECADLVIAGLQRLQNHAMAQEHRVKAGTP